MSVLGTKRQAPVDDRVVPIDETAVARPSGQRRFDNDIKEQDLQKCSSNLIQINFRAADLAAFLFVECNRSFRLAEADRHLLFSCSLLY
jgi:hypothetical protein